MTLKIGEKFLDKPIIQGGMGAKVSLHKLASAVAQEGGIGTISAVLLHEKNRKKELKYTCKGIEVEKLGLKPYLYAKELANEIKLAKKLAPNGIIAVNIMFALTHFYELLMTAIDAGADLIIQGAGFSKDVFKICKKFDQPLAVIVSNVKAAKLSERLGANIIIVESGDAGGHLGTLEPIWKVAPEIIEAVNIPVILAGGIYDNQDIKKAFSLGAKGVQMATRFVTTYECDAHENFKKMYIKAKKEDVVIIKSPVGMPARALKNPFVERLLKEKKIAHKCPFDCLKTCSGEDSIYCIADVLLKSVSGDVENGLVFCGSNVYKVNEIISVKDLMKDLTNDL